MTAVRQFAHLVARPLRSTSIAALGAACLLAAAPAAGASLRGASPLPWSGVPGYSYPAGQTDQLGVPGEEVGASVTPEGAIFTPSVEVTPWLSGPRPGISARRGLPDPRVPLVATGRGHAGATAAWWATTLHGVPAAIAALQPGSGRDAGVALRWGGTQDAGDAPPRYRYARPATPSQEGLYSQRGEPFAPGTCWRQVPLGADGSAIAVERGDRVAAVVVGLASSSPRPLPGVRVHGCTRSPSSWAASVRGRPRPGGRISVIVPLTPLPAADPRVAALASADVRATGIELAARWRERRSAAAQLRLPEPALQRAYEAALVTMLVPRYRASDGSWVQTVNTLQYHAYWIRDAAMIGTALSHAGYAAEAAENLSFLGRWQLPSGRFSSRPGQGDGHGQALWLLGQHVRLSGDADLARTWAPAVRRAVDWTAQALDASPLGLLPPSDPGDNELAAGTLSGDQFWGVAGLDAAAALASLAGDSQLAADAAALRNRLQQRTVAAARASAGPEGIAAVLDAAGGQRWGQLWAAWPYPTLAPRDPLVQQTMDAAWGAQREGVATWNGYLHLYTGFRAWQTMLRAGEQTRPLQGLYATLAHLSSSGGGFETSVRPYGTRKPNVNLAPHGWLAAELVTYVRDLLAREQDGGLVLLGAMPGAWLTAGRITEARELPTAFGQLRVRWRATSRGGELRWQLTPRPGATAPAAVTMPLPPSVRGASVSGDGTISGRTLRLAGTGGTVRLRWQGARRPGPTLAGTIAQLQRDYVRRGQTPPR